MTVTHYITDQPRANKVVEATPLRSVPHLGRSAENMTTDSLRSLLQTRFEQAVEITHFEPKDWFMDQATKQTWQSHLKNIISRRLVSAAKRGVDPHVIRESESFLSHVERLTPEKTLYSFAASATKTHFTGWAVDNSIVFCLQDTHEN